MTLYMPSPTIDEMQQMTGEELAERDDLGRGELIKGVFVKMPPPGTEHGRIESKIGRYIGNFVEESDLGETYVGETGVYTARHPDTVRGVDTAYVSWERLEKNQSTTYLDVPPELVVEVLSPGNRWVEILDKVDEYLNIGVDLVWIVDPKRREVFAYRSLDEVRRYAVGDVLTAEDILPNFELSLEKLFRKGRKPT